MLWRHSGQKERIARLRCESLLGPLAQSPLFWALFLGLGFTMGASVTCMGLDLAIPFGAERGLCGDLMGL